jgi:hypothetical protein
VAGPLKVVCPLTCASTVTRVTLNSGCSKLYD